MQGGEGGIVKPGPAAVLALAIVVVLMAAAVGFVYGIAAALAVITR